MIFNSTYQQDSLREPISLKDYDSLSESGGLMITGSESVSPENSVNVEIQKTDSERTVSRPENKKVQQNQHSLAQKMKFIEPRSEVILVTNQVAKEALHLPERSLNRINYDWITLLLLIGLALFASVRTSWNNYLMSLFQSTVNYSTALRMFQEKNNSLLQGAFQLDILFYLIFSVFVFQTMKLFGVELPYKQFYAYLFCLVLVVSFFLIKKVIYRLMGALIEKKGETKEFLFNVDNFKRVAGLLLLPVVAVIAFYPFRQENIPVLAGLAAIVLLYSLLTFRGFAILLSKQFSIFYLFLYFCTLEILPLVLLYKILVV